MKILMVDKFYFVKGGVERYLFELKGLLEQRGHQVIPFSMQHEKNEPTEYESYFVDNMDFAALGGKSLFKKIQTAGRVLYSFHAKKRLKALIRDTKPDVAHLHMIDHQISSSILHTLKKYKIPIIQTVHQYKLVCPNYRFYIEHKGEICERCLKGNYFNAVLQRCHKKSFSASLLITLEAYLHKILKTHEIIDKFHVPSKFIGSKLEQGGIDESKIIHHFLTLNMDEYPYAGTSEDYFLYYGRLSGEKGLMTLLKAYAKLKQNVNLYIVGDGPSRPELEEFVRKDGLNSVSFLGYQSGNHLKKLLAGAKFVVVPSEWYENSPFVIYEPFCTGKPVLGAKIGGIPEFICDGVTGLLFKSGDSEMLMEKLQQLIDDPDHCFSMGSEARKFAEEHFKPETHCEWILKKYKELLS